jgi:3-oxoadipate enol-lactonase
MSIAAINNIDMYYEVHGEGEPLLLISGTGGDLTSWRLFIPGLMKHFKVIVFDNRGAGRSSVTEGPYTTHQLAEDSVALLDHLRIDSAHVLGYSFGGSIALDIAIQYPVRVKKLMLVAATAKSSALNQEISQALLEIAKLPIDKEAQMQLILPWIYSNRFFEDKAQVEAWIEMACTRPYPPSVEGLEAQTEAVKSFDMAERLNEIKSETLVVAAEEDYLKALNDVKWMSDQITNSIFKTLPGGHGFVAEYPKEFQKMILSFLEA